MCRKVILVLFFSLWLCNAVYSQGQPIGCYEQAIQWIVKDSTASSFYKDSASNGLMPFKVHDSLVSAVGSTFWMKEICGIFYDRKIDKRYECMEPCGSLYEADKRRYHKMENIFSKELAGIRDCDDPGLIFYFYDYNDSLLMVDLIRLVGDRDEINLFDVSWFASEIHYLFVHRENEIVHMYVNGPWYD